MFENLNFYQYNKVTSTKGSYLNWEFFVFVLLSKERGRKTKFKKKCEGGSAKKL